MHKQRLAVVLAAVVGIISGFLPWFTGFEKLMEIPLFKAAMEGRVSDSGTITGMSGGDGVLTLVLFLIVIIIAILGDRAAGLSKGKKTGVIVLGVILLLFGLYEMTVLDGFKAIASSAEQAILEDIKVGFGVYVLVIASLATVVLPIVIKGNSAPQEA